MGMGMDSSFMGIMVDKTSQLRDGTLCGGKKEGRIREGRNRCEDIFGVEGGSTTSVSFREKVGLVAGRWHVDATGGPFVAVVVKISHE